jgi:hypothetical protein
VADDLYNGDLSADCQGVETLFQGIPEGLTPGETAVLLASRGLKVFPCEPDLKSPAIAGGFKSASTNVRLSGEWVRFTSPSEHAGAWFHIADCNLAFEPGAIGVLIVDIDPKSGGDESWAALEAEHGKTPATLEVSTPSGGRHLYFHGIGPSTAKKLGRGIDTRGIGGYALLPPSSINGRHYTWLEGPIAPLPEWIAEILATEADPVERSEERTAAYEAWRDEGNDGGRFDFFLSLIGDHEGGEGFYGPMTKAAGCGARLGMPLDEIVARIREAALNTNRRNHTLSYINEKIALLPQAVRAFQAKDTARLRNEEPEEEEPSEPEEPLEEPEPEEEEVDEEDTAKEEEPVTDPRHVATKELRRRAKEWLLRPSKHKPAVLALHSPAGLGKTRAMLLEQQQAEPEERDNGSNDAPNNYQYTGDPLDEDVGSIPEQSKPTVVGKMAVAVGRHALGEEIQQTDQDLRPAGDETRIPRLVGRNAENCARWDVVDAGFKKGFSQASFCEQTLPDGTSVRCPLFDVCSSIPGQYQYIQEEVQSAPNIIITHQHLTIPWLRAIGLKNRKRMWMDEDPTGVFRVRQELTDEDLLDLVTAQDFDRLEQWEEAVPTFKKPQRRARKALQNLEKLVGALLAGLTGKPQVLKIEHLAEWTPGQLREMARARELVETWRRGKLDPSLDDAALKKQLDKRKPIRHMAPLLRRLADELEARKTGPIYSLERDKQTHKIIARGRIPTDDLPPNLLITDATLSPEIIKAVFPDHELEHVKIEVPRNALIAQVKDLTFSRNWLLKEKHLPEVTAWLDQLAQHYKNLVVITTKHIRCAITEEDPKAKLPAYCETYHETHGIKIAHYGNIRGSNKFADCDALVILGREQPNPGEIEALAKAFWYDAKKPLRLVPTIAGAGKNYSPASRAYEMIDGTTVQGKVEVHPDPRCQAVLASVRENEMIQALDRARLIWNPDRKHIYILSSIPLPGVKVDHLVSWDNLRGASRLHKALSAQVARGENCLPFASEWLTTNYPKLWKNENEARNWAVRDPQVLDIMRKDHGPNTYILLEGGSFLEFAIVEYLLNDRKPGHNQWSKALVWGGDAPGVALSCALGIAETEFRWRPA